jgi:hypothetical protein
VRQCRVDRVRENKCHHLSIIVVVKQYHNVSICSMRPGQPMWVVETPLAQRLTDAEIEDATGAGDGIRRRIHAQ